MNADLHTLTEKKKLQGRIRILLVIFIGGLILSGITAFPIQFELKVAHQWIRHYNLQNSLTDWIERAYAGVRETNAKFPFISYGTDWLAFAHLVLAVAFIGPLRMPLKNIWVIEFGLIACFAVIPMAITAGEVRGIPVFWRLLDCMFGIAGGIVLTFCYLNIKKLETLNVKR